MEKRKDKDKFSVNTSNKETILDFVERKLSENASIRELMKDEFVRFTSIRDFLYFKFCPGYFGMCPNSKNKKTRCAILQTAGKEDLQPFSTWF